MIYREIALPEPVQRLALCAWQFEVEDSDPPSFQHHVPPDGAAGLALIRSPEGVLRPNVMGPMLAAFVVPVARGWSYVGLRLRPEMAGRLLAAPPGPGIKVDGAIDGPLAPI